MSRALPPLSQYAVMEWRLVKHRDNVTFTLHLGVCLRAENRTQKTVNTKLEY